MLCLRAVWIQNVIAPAQAMNIARTRVLFGCRRIGEAILAAATKKAGSAVLHECLRAATAQCFTVAGGETLDVPVTAKPDGTIVHFVIASDDSDALTFCVVVTTGSGDVAKWATPTPIAKAGFITGALKTTTGAAYKLHISNTSHKPTEVAFRVICGHAEASVPVSAEVAAAAGASIGAK